MKSVSPRATGRTSRWDADRILHSRAYTRYIDKTQVFYLISHEQISHRVLHVQLLSKIAGTIGKFLRLNEDLLEAIALGHDIGHPSFGDDGERILWACARPTASGFFSTASRESGSWTGWKSRGGGSTCLSRFWMGSSATTARPIWSASPPRGTRPLLPLRPRLRPSWLTRPLLKPMTLEGCVVRLADTISYIGRDLEDAITLKLLLVE